LFASRQQRPINVKLVLVTDLAAASAKVPAPIKCRLTPDKAAPASRVDVASTARRSGNLHVNRRAAMAIHVKPEPLLIGRFLVEGVGFEPT
jgi:hypothetical protein